VAFGALLFQWYFSQLFLAVRPSFPNSCILFTTIWCIYLVDRQIDFTLKTPSDERHVFQFKYQKWMFCLVGILSILSIVLLFFIPSGIISLGYFLSLAIAAYWFIWSKGWFASILASKEVFTAFFYCTGVCLLNIYQGGISTSFMLYFSLFFFIVLHHLLLFNSLETSFLPNWSHFLRVIEILCVLCIGFLFFRYKEEKDWWNLSPLVLTFCIQVCIHYFAYSLKSRVIGELAYFSPIIYFTYEFFSK
jgi:hypothetical protein